MSITKEQIFMAADELDSSGRKATLSAVRELIGGGSYETISPALREWKLKKTAAQRPLSDPADRRSAYGIVRARCGLQRDNSIAENSSPLVRSFQPWAKLPPTILPTVLCLYALVDVIRNDFKHFATKIGWMINLCVVPPLGTLLYFLIGRHQRTTNYPVGRLVVFCMFLIPILMIIGYLLFSSGHLNFIHEPPKIIQI